MCNLNSLGVEHHLNFPNLMVVCVFSSREINFFSQRNPDPSLMTVMPTYWFIMLWFHTFSVHCTLQIFIHLSVFFFYHFIFITVYFLKFPFKYYFPLVLFCLIFMHPLTIHLFLWFPILYCLSEETSTRDSDNVKLVLEANNQIENILV